MSAKKAKVPKVADNDDGAGGSGDYYGVDDVSAQDSDENYVNGEFVWWSLPEPILLRILWLLPVKDIVSAGRTCWRWRNIANDELLWRRKFQLHYRVPHDIQLKPDAVSWKQEYQRLTTEIPLMQTQELDGHKHQVLHVSFSHNGEMFATCSKDGYVIIWNSEHPCSERYGHNMKQFSWKYTQYSQFNQSDTLLLVSGVHFGQIHSTSGEIAVFTVDGKTESHLRCRVVNRPYDIFGTWFSDQYLISGDLHWLAHLVSTSVLWLNKANQEIDSEHVPIMNQLYKFYNKNASSVRAIMIAKCPWLNESNDPLAGQQAAQSHSDEEMDDDNSSIGNPLSHMASRRNLRLNSETMHEFLNDISEQSSSSLSAATHHAANACSSSAAAAALPPTSATGSDAIIRYSDDYRRDFGGASGSGSAGAAGDAAEQQPMVDDEEMQDNVPDDNDDMENAVPRYLIFSTGSKSYTPHQVGFKRIRNVNFPRKLDPGLSLKERIAARKAAVEQEQNQPRPGPDWWNYEAVADRFDKVDKVIDLHGHIIGMALSPDHRYLYVNTRPWPDYYKIKNPLEPPPIAEEIDIHVIDLMTLEQVGNMLRAHKAYTPSTECFFIFLDVCDNYVASGAEDKHAYLWDRYYGISLAKYNHTDVVNSVAFNPRDSEMLVTTSDDYKIKIWRSTSKAKALGIANMQSAIELKRKTVN